MSSEVLKLLNVATEWGGFRVLANLSKNIALAFDEKLGIPNTKINFACDFLNG